MAQMNEKQVAFLDALFGEAKGDFYEAKRIAGYSETYSVPQIVKPLKEEIEARTREFIALNGPKAAFSLISVMEQPKELGSAMKLAAAKDLLDRAGFSKTDKIEVKTDNPLFVLPPKNEN